MSGAKSPQLIDNPQDEREKNASQYHRSNGYKNSCIAPLYIDISWQLAYPAELVAGEPDDDTSHDHQRTYENDSFP
jgi:hypothetical protein